MYIKNSILRTLSLVLLVVVFALSLVVSNLIGKQSGKDESERYYSDVMRNQWKGEIKRLEYAFENTDSCATDNCLEVWSEILGRDVQSF